MNVVMRLMNMRDDINDDNTPHGGVLILDENEGDDYKQLSFDLGEEDIRNKPSNQPAHQIVPSRFLNLPLISTYVVVVALLASRHLNLGDL